MKEHQNITSGILSYRGFKYTQEYKDDLYKVYGINIITLIDIGYSINIDITNKRISVTKVS